MKWNDRNKTVAADMCELARWSVLFWDATVMFPQKITNSYSMYHSLAVTLVTSIYVSEERTSKMCCFLLNNLRRAFLLQESNQRISSQTKLVDW